jgi:hypothetical protein
MSGIVYLVQPAELIGTNRYKIGCSGKNDLSRCKNGYKNGTRYITIMECTEPYKIEAHIIRVFNEKFMLIAGKEYFEGNETDMKTNFFEIVTNYKPSEKPSIPDKQDLTCNVCSKEFGKLSLYKRHIPTCKGPKLEGEKSGSDYKDASANSSKIQCKLCSSSFARFTIYKKHMEKIHINPNSVASKQQKEDLVPPKSTKTNKTATKDSKQVKCDVCSKTFLNKYNLKRHVDNSCNPTPEQLLKGLKPSPALSILTALIKSGCLGGTTNNTK